MNFHNSKIIEFGRLIHVKSIGLWWGPYIWVLSSYCQLLCLMNIACFFVLLIDMHVIYFVFIIVHWPCFMIAHSYLLLIYAPTHTSFIYLLSCSICFIIWSFHRYPLISLSIVTLASFYLVEGCFGLSPYLLDK